MRVPRDVSSANANDASAGSVEAAVLGQNPDAECIDQSGKSRSTGLDHFSGDQVGVDDDGSQFAEDFRHCRLTGSDASSEANSQHTRQSLISAPERFRHAY